VNFHARPWTAEEIELIDRRAQFESRESFWAYRKYIAPQMLLGWWQREVALELHRFWLEFRAGRRPRLLLQSPPQHGKSTMVTDFLSWVIGQDPTLKIIFSSYSDRLGTVTNLRLQRIFNNPKHAAIFGDIRGDMPGQSNSEVIEFCDGKGVFRNTTVQGAVTGEGLDIGVIDDPIKGRAEASSQVTREKTWNWFTDDFLPRFSDHAALVMIMTRWHLDDPAGRLLERYSGVRSLRYPALAEQDEVHIGLDGRSFIRKEGEPLFPELKSLVFLDKQRSIMTRAGWQSIYQQTPIAVGGDMFPIDKVELVSELPAQDRVRASVRYWDKAGTKDGGAFTAGVLMLRMDKGTFIVGDVRRGRWSALDRERMITQTAELDRKVYDRTRVYVEQEPGSGGKESAEATIRSLAGFAVEADRVSGSKEVRADPFAAQWQAGNVRLLSAPWTREYLSEHECFPAGRYKDQVDASSGAFNKLASKYRYPSDMSWVS
jgi:predicted phage terminase large subunit-like protein